MTKTTNFARRVLRGSTALQALALLGAGIGAVGVAAPALAQDYSQVNATGRVQGTNGEPIAGANVTVTSNGQGFSRTVTTGNDGSFRVPSLPQGSYTFVIEASGFDTLTDNGVSLTQGASANQFTLASAGAGGAAGEGEIVVTAGRVQVVDFDRNTTGAVINVGELATRVPVSRDVTSVILLAPGTAAGDTTFGNLPSIAGASVSENTYYVNGLNITDFSNGLGAVTVPFDFYQTLEVKTGGISAEFGRFTGGFVNATTKSGSNEFHGGITFNWEPDDLRSDVPNTYLSDSDSVKSERKEFIAQLSGPIIKDHLFFYGLYNSRDIRSEGGTTNTAARAGVGVSGCATNPTYCSDTYPGPAGANLVLAGTGFTQSITKSPFYGGKLDAVIVDGQRLEATYFNSSNLTQTNTFGNATGTFAAGTRYNLNTNNPGQYNSTNVARAGGENYVFRYTGTFTDWFTLSGAYGRSYNRATSESSTPDFPSIVDQRGGGSVSIGNPTGNSSTRFDRRTFYRADADLYVNLFGNHHFRGGYDREDLAHTEFNQSNGNYQLIYANSGAINPTTGTTSDAFITQPNVTYVSRRFFRNGGFFTTNGEAFYLQDSWTFFGNRANIVAGVRSDQFINKNADGQTFFNSDKNWAPRLSASFDPIGDGKTKIYGSFGRYFLPVATNTNIRLAGPELDYTQFYALAGVNANNTPIYGAPLVVRPTSAGGSGTVCPAQAVEPTAGNVANCTVNSDGTSPPFNSLVDANLKSQSEDEYQLGYEQRFGSRIKVGAVFTYRKLRQSLEDAYVDAGVVGYCNRDTSITAAQRASCLATFSGAHQYALLNPGNDVNVVLDGSLLDGRAVTLTAADLGLPQARRTYRAMTVTFDREFDGKWSFSANYTISALVGNIEGGVRSDNGQADSGLTTNFDYPALVDGAYGYLPNHRRHNIKAYGSYQIGDFLTVGANVQVTSPRKFGCIGTVPVSRDGGKAAAYGAAGFYCNVRGDGSIANTTVAQGGAAFTPQLTPRGSRFQSDWLYQVGLDASLRIPTDAFDGYLRVSVFNVLNQQQQLDFTEVGTTGGGAPSPNYGLPTVYQAPRSVRLQFGVNF